MERPSGEPMTCERPAASDDGDADILALFAAADDGGLKLLLERHGAAVRTAVGKHFWGRRALTTLELDDVMNAACMLVWQHRDDYRPDRGTLHGWLYMVALNAARLLVRSRQRWIGKTSGHDLGLVPAPPPGQPLRALPFLELLRECIAKLSPQQRQVLEADLAAGGLADAKWLAAE